MRQLGNPMREICSFEWWVFVAVTPRRHPTGNGWMALPFLTNSASAVMGTAS